MLKNTDFKLEYYFNEDKSLNKFAISPKTIFDLFSGLNEKCLEYLEKVIYFLFIYIYRE